MNFYRVEDHHYECATRNWRIGVCLDGIWSRCYFATQNWGIGAYFLPIALTFIAGFILGLFHS